MGKRWERDGRGWERDGNVRAPSRALGMRLLHPENRQCRWECGSSGMIPGLSLPPQIPAGAVGAGFGTAREEPSPALPHIPRECRGLGAPPVHPELHPSSGGVLCPPALPRSCFSPHFHGIPGITGFRQTLLALHLQYIDFLFFFFSFFLFFGPFLQKPPTPAVVMNSCTDSATDFGVKLRARLQGGSTTQFLHS